MTARQYGSNTPTAEGGDVDVPGWLLRPILRTPSSLFHIRIPTDFDELLNEAIAALPMRYGAHANNRVPLPLFIARPTPLTGAASEADAPEWSINYLREAVAWEDLLSVDRDKVEVVRLARQRWTARP